MEQYFEDWKKVINFAVLKQIVASLDIAYASKPITPNKGDVFKAFKKCDYNNLRVVIIGQDPYPQKGVATGLAFANKIETAVTKEISPSLELLMENILKDVTSPFPMIDITLEKWAEQGILLLNSALTVEIGNPGTHTMLWRPFITSLLENLSEINSGIIYVLFGSTARSFKPYINQKSNYILEYNHPAYYARLGQPMECDAWSKINEILKKNHNLKINFYE